MSSSRAERRAEAKYRVMRLLKDNPHMSTRDIASAVNISNGAAYYLLHALIDKGFVKAKNFSASNRKTQYMYVLTPSGIAEKSKMTRLFLERKLMEYRDLKVEIEQLKAEVVMEPGGKDSRS